MSAATSWTRFRSAARRRADEQVAAVCYRLGRRGMEFLLVQTRGSGRWTFPKGGAEPRITLAQSAALEAFEEAGVHGCIEESPFARYARSGSRQAASAITVSVYLCEVSRLDRPQESGRNPTWFSAEKAKRRLQQDRSRQDGAELARVLDRAVARIDRLQRQRRRLAEEPRRDSLQKVQFEDRQQAAVYAHVAQACFARDARRRRVTLPTTDAIDVAVNAELCKVLQFAGPAKLPRNQKLLPAKR